MTGAGGGAPTVVVAGWIGSTNLGDELIASELTRRLTERGYVSVAPSLDPERTERQLGIEAIPHRSIGANRKAIRRADALLFGGGSLIQDMTSQLSLPYHLSRPWFAGKTQVPFAGIGLDAGPLRSRWGRRLTRMALRGARIVGVRNVESANLLRSIGVINVMETADLTFAHPIPVSSATERIVVCLRPPVFGGLRPVASRSHIQDPEWIRAAALALDQLAESTGLGVHFVAMQIDRDRVVHQAVQAAMRAEATHADPTLETVYETIGSARLVVAMRYHGGIGAVVGGRPAVMLGYSSKVDSLVRQVGEGFVGLGTDTDALASIPEAAATIMDRSDAVLEARARLRSIERLNEDILDRLLEGHPS